ncbi:MAG: hypothetical protein KDI78_15630, partial [Xanthomonadales bacterium]|nr:hypothetical protein [Xanthomonadales bacterium]
MAAKGKPRRSGVFHGQQSLIEKLAYSIGTRRSAIKRAMILISDFAAALDLQHRHQKQCHDVDDLD